MTCNERGGICAERAGGVGTRSGFGRVVSGNDPRAGDGILAEFHRQKENTARNRSQPGFGAVISTRHMRNAQKRNGGALL